MSSWFDRQVDSWIDREVDKVVDQEIDKFLEPYLGKDELRRLKKLARKGQPLDADTEALLRNHLSAEQLEDYRKIHNSVAKAERLDSDLGKLDSDLRAIDDLFG